MTERYGCAIVWLRRDLRLDDNVALARACDAAASVVCAFVLDPALLRSERVGAPIVSFFFDALAELRTALRERGSDLALLEGDFARELLGLARRLDAGALFFNADYDPEAKLRDAAVVESARKAGLATHAFADHVYYGATDVVQQKTDRAYTVFTPYRRRWLERHAAQPHPPEESLAKLGRRLVPAARIATTREVPEPSAFGHERLAGFPRGGESLGRAALASFVRRHAGAYDEQRNFPEADATSHLSPHLRAGTIGIRRCVAAILEARGAAPPGAVAGYDTWLSELIWRDFYQQVLANFPHVATEPFVAAASAIRYVDDEAQWTAWESGRTGYPIVDAAIAQIRTTGWMHNRLRMIVASFLTKDQLLDYRRGERFFERHLADGDLAANNGGWQWSASTGADAAPYFRIFNPVTQSKRFDPEGRFIRRMLPELAWLRGPAIHEPWTLSPLEQEAAGVRIGRDYPAPIVDHAEARLRALSVLTPILGARGGSLPKSGGRVKS